MRKFALRSLAPAVVAIVSAMTVAGGGHAHDLWLTTEGGAKAATRHRQLWASARPPADGRG